MIELNLEKEGGVRGTESCSGAFDNTNIFARSLGALRDAGGGVLTVPAGIWHTGPIELSSGTTLHLCEGAVVSFIPEPERYQPVFTRWEGVECHAMHPCLYGSGANNVSVTGSGIIDGNGSVWWALLHEKRARRQAVPEMGIEIALAALNPGYKTQPGGGGGRDIQYLRPPLVQFYKCSNVRLEGITVRNSPFWTIHPLYCDGVTISNVKVENPHDAPNTDGIDVDSSVNVTIENSRVTVGDDGIALKSGSGADGIKVNRPTAHVTVRNCEVGNGHGGIVIGSETAAGIHDILAEKCTFHGTDRGVRIKTRRGRGGQIADLVFRDLVMEGNLCPIAINMYYRCGVAPGEKDLFSLDKLPVTDSTPSIRRVTISGLHATGCRSSAGFIAGLPEAPIEDLSVVDCVLSTDETSAEKPDDSEMFLGLPSVSVKSFRILNAQNPVMKNVTITGPLQPFFLG